MCLKTDISRHAFQCQYMPYFKTHTFQEIRSNKLVARHSCQDTHSKTHDSRQRIQHAHSKTHTEAKQRGRNAKPDRICPPGANKDQDILRRMFARHRSPSAWQSKPCPVRIRLPQTSDAQSRSTCRGQARIMHPLPEHGSMQLYITSCAWQPSQPSSSGSSRSAFEA